MPLFRNETHTGLDEETEGLESEDDDDKSKNDKAKKEKTATMLAAASGEEYAKMPYPTIIDLGSAGSVLPRNWCPHARLPDGPLKGGTYSTANGGSIKNDGGTRLQ